MKGRLTMSKGRIFYLSGLTSTGKTSMIRELMSRREWSFFKLGFDMFEEAIPEWAYCDTAYSAAIRAMYQAARSLCLEGHDVVVDGLIMRMEGLERHYDALKEILKDCDLRLIHVVCSPDELMRRNIARGDRHAEQSEAQARLEERDIPYSLTISSRYNSASQCADILLSYAQSGHSGEPVFERITRDNFGLESLDGFVRTQEVTDVYFKADGEYRLTSHPFIDDWTPELKREKALEMLDDGYIAYGAFDGGRVIGLILLKKELDHDRMIVDSFHVSAEHRHRGIGRRLFAIAAEEGRRAGAIKLYLSACSSKETIGFYRAMGCVLAEDIIAEMAEDEPYDLQLEYKL